MTFPVHRKATRSEELPARGGYGWWMGKVSLQPWLSAAPGICLNWDLELDPCCDHGLPCAGAETGYHFLLHVVAVEFTSFRRRPWERCACTRFILTFCGGGL